MKRLRPILAIGALSLLLAACGSSSPALTSPDQPRLNGSGFGSGNAIADTSATSTASAPTGTLADSTTQRNGSGFGSGN